jgi:hypothetical protein
MKTLTKLEEVFLVLLSIYLFSILPFAWWIYPLFFFAPDLSMIGLLSGNRPGAIIYNVVHHKALAVSAYLLGCLLGIPALSLIGVVLLGHSSFDRACGFGLLDPNLVGQKLSMPVSGKA